MPAKKQAKSDDSDDSSSVGASPSPAEIDLLLDASRKGAQRKGGSSAPPDSSGVLCYCCYSLSADGSPTWLFACTYCRICSIGLSLILLGVLIAEASVGVIAGQSFVQRHRQLEPNLTDCVLSAAKLAGEDFFCDVGEGAWWTPANWTRRAWFPACTSTYLIEEMAEFNRRHAWELVHFPSRQGELGQEDVSLDAWWLPASDSQAPRIVVVHGNGGNFNDWSVQLPAYFLRSMGFAVLLPNLRGFGSSEAASAQVTWGWAYQLDVLGAWDYLRRDPDQRLGGALPPEKVGIQGVSLGAFAASVAAGIDPRVPGVWLDTPIYDPQNLMLFQLRRIVGTFLAPFFVRVAWLFANQFAGVQLDAFTPAKVLPSSRQEPGAAACNVGVVADLQDSAVPVSEAELLVQLLRSGATPAYEVLADDKAGVSRCGRENHLVLPVWAPDAYREKLCHFWAATFGLSEGECHLEDLPRFAMDISASVGWEDRPERPGFG